MALDNSSRCSRPCYDTSPTLNRHTSSRTATWAYTSLASATRNSSRPYLVRPLPPHFSSLSLPVDTLDYRVLRPVASARRACLAADRMPVFRACVPRLPRCLSLQTLSGPGVLRAARTGQRRGPHRGRSIRSMGGSDLLGSAPDGHPERDLLYHGRQGLELRWPGRCVHVQGNILMCVG
jgi:hypothetical protein